jgi:hypothetical protein
MTRRVVLVLGCLSCILAFPATASAWWEFIEGFSGPRSRFGWDIEIRLACFNKVDPVITRTAERVRSRALFSPGDDVVRVQTLLKEARFQDAFDLIETTAARIDRDREGLLRLATFAAPRVPNRAAIDQIISTVPTAPQSLDDVATKFLEGLRAIPLNVNSDFKLLGPVKLTDDQQRQVVDQLRSTVVERATGLSVPLINLAEELRKAENQLTDLTGLVMGVPFAGLMFTACPLPDEHVRQGSIDLGFHFNRSKDPEFANGERVTLVMLTPSYSWRLNSMLDAGTGGGVYWFSSTGTPRSAAPLPSGEIDRSGIAPFSGVVLDPIHFDIHAARSTRKPGPAFLSGFLVRVGAYWFPAGFETNAFGVDIQKPAEVQKRISFFYDFEPIRKHCSDSESRRWYCWPFGD